jgi:hypothetical protein
VRCRFDSRLFIERILARREGLPNPIVLAVVAAGVASGFFHPPRIATALVGLGLVRTSPERPDRLGSIVMPKIQSASEFTACAQSGMPRSKRSRISVDSTARSGRGNERAMAMIERTALRADEEEELER